MAKLQRGELSVEASVPLTGASILLERGSTYLLMVSAESKTLEIWSKEGTLTCISVTESPLEGKQRSGAERK